jgi:hypothetical protein
MRTGWLPNPQANPDATGFHRMMRDMKGLREKKEKIGLISYPNSNLFIFFANSDSFSSVIKKTEGHKPHLTKIPNIKLWKFP